MDFSNLDFKFQEIADKRVVDTLDKIGQALVKIYGAIPKTVVLPKIFNVQGKVSVDNPVQISNFKELDQRFASLETKLTLWAQAASTAKTPQIQFPKFEMPKQEVTPIDMQPTIDAIHELREQLANVPKNDSGVAILRKIQNAMEEMVARPVMTPQPVTNISINALNGFPKSTSVAVTSTRTRIPGYGQLFNRRSLILFNNSSSTTLYLGDSNVTSTTGLPILGQTYSPAIDAGYDLILYGVVASGNADVRVLEVSKDQTANIQE